jgi:hypothetical protein
MHLNSPHRRNLFLSAFAALICRAPDGVEGGGEAAPVTETPNAEAAPENLDNSFLGGATGEEAPAEKPEGDAPADDKPIEGEEGEKTDEQKADEAREAAIARLALPTPEAYEVKVPEGFDALDEEALAAATPLLQKMGVKTNEEAQEVIDLFASEIAPKMLARASEQTQAQVQQAVNDVKKGWADETRADADIGGGNFKPSMALAAKALDKFGGPDLRKMLDETGIGFHPALVKFAVNVGRQLGESEFHVSDTSAQEKTTMAQRWYGEEFQPKQ